MRFVDIALAVFWFSFQYCSLLGLMLLIGIFLCMMTHYDFISMRNVQVSLEGSDIGIVYRNSHYFQGTAALWMRFYPQVLSLIHVFIYFTFFLLKSWVFFNGRKCVILFLMKVFRFSICTGCTLDQDYSCEGRSTRKLNNEPNSNVT